MYSLGRREIEEGGASASTEEVAGNFVHLFLGRHWPRHRVFVCQGIVGACAAAEVPLARGAIFSFRPLIFAPESFFPVRADLPLLLGR